MEVQRYLGHPSTAVFVAAVAVVLLRWAPGAADRGTRVALFALAGLAALVAIAYPLHTEVPGLGIAAVVAGLVLCFAFYLWVEPLKMDPGLPSSWKEKRGVESGVVLSSAFLIVLLWQNLE